MDLYSRVWRYITRGERCLVLQKISSVKGELDIRPFEIRNALADLFFDFADSFIRREELGKSFAALANPYEVELLLVK
jgi:hypothetical protein